MEESYIYYQLQNGPVNKQLYSEYINKLAGKLANFQIVQSVLVMDNVASHHTTLVKEAAEANNLNILYLPPYSPFLNPIEYMFSKWKEIVKRMSPTWEMDLLQAIEDGANMITSNDCEGYYRNMLSYITRCLNNEIIEN